MSQRVLITGGFGYLGSRIAVALARCPCGYKVRLGSRKPQPSPSWLPEAETAVVNILDSETFPLALKDTQIVVHLAAMNENECLIDPSKALLVNGLGTLQILQASIASGVERFIYLSTAHVYGAPLQGHITEKSVPRPIHPYAVTHRVAEDFVLAAHDKKELHGVVLRLSNGFGAPMHAEVDRWTLLVSDLCRQIVQTGKIVLRSHGLQQRNFITLNDVEQGIVHMLGLNRENNDNGIFNLGGDSTLSILDMTQRVAACCQRMLGFLPEIICPAPSLKDELIVSDLIYDSSKIKLTGLQLTNHIDIALEESLSFTMKFFEENIHVNI
jgi:UDP-glucose 4-epimerase